MAQSNIADLNDRLGKGINMGNMFEAPAEIEWGNPFQDDYFSMIAELGFDHVRIPIRWDTQARTSLVAPYNINPDFFQRIREVVDLALNEGLMVIINMHHHEDLFQNPAANKARFLSQWEQIGRFFQDYSETLLFEILNEPHGELTPELWNDYFEEALMEIRKSNPTRGVLMGTALFGGVSGIFELQPPKDDNLIVTVHYYNPFGFTHQGAEWVGEQTQTWLGTKWYDLAYEREALIQELQPLVAFSETHDIPIHMGEFGAYEKADMESRRLWTNFLARHFESLGFSWAYWEWSAGFGIYDPQTGTFREPLVGALLHDPLGDPREAYPETIYESDFSSSTDGWQLFTQQEALASLDRNDGKLEIMIQTPGSENWHVQLAKGTLPLEKGQLYRVSFLGSATEGTSITQYIGQAAAPYTAYSEYQGFGVSEEEKSYSYVFTMTEKSDPMARAVFDLGNKATKINISEFKVEKLNFLISSLPLSPKEHPVFYPNPVQDYLSIEGLNPGTQLEIYASSGQLLDTMKVNEEGRIYFGHLTSGTYLLSTLFQGHPIVYRLLKE